MFPFRISLEDARASLATHEAALAAANTAYADDPTDARWSDRQNAAADVARAKAALASAGERAAADARIASERVRRDARERIPKLLKLADPQDVLERNEKTLAKIVALSSSLASEVGKIEDAINEAMAADNEAHRLGQLLNGPDRVLVEEDCVGDGRGLLPPRAGAIGISFDSYERALRAVVRSRNWAAASTHPRAKLILAQRVEAWVGAAP
jgi:hypothetical protein